MVPSIQMHARSRQSGWKRFTAMALLVAAISALVYLWNPIEKTQAVAPAPAAAAVSARISY